MPSIIKLIPYLETPDGGHMYLIFQGNISSKKLTNPPRFLSKFYRMPEFKEVTPVCFVYFRENPLSDPPSGFIELDSTINVGKKVLIPVAKSVYPAEVELASSEKIALRVKSHILVVQYQVLKIIEELPEIYAGNLRDLRNAQEFIWDYSRKYPDSKYNGIINEENLERILASAPIDSLGNPLENDGDTLLVLDSTPTKEGDLTDLLKKF